MSVKQTETKATPRPRAKRTSASNEKYLLALVRNGRAIDLEDAKHVAKLVRSGTLQLGKGGPALKELLRPGPELPGVSKHLRRDRRSR